MATALDRDIRDKAKVLFISGRPVKAIATDLNLSPTTVAKWRERGQWCRLRDDMLSPVSRAITEHVSLGIEQASREAKNRLSGVIMSHTAVLRDNPGDSIDDLRNTPDGEGRASLVKRIAETASMVYGWDNDKSNTLVVVGLVGTLDPDNQAPVASDTVVDVEATASDKPV